MASSRPSQCRKSGGFLNNVTGVIKDYAFVDDAFPDSKSKFNSLHVRLDFLEDGAEEPVTTHLWAGGADDFEISDDGHTLTPIEENGGLGQGVPWIGFVASMVDAGFNEELLPEDEINYEPIIGARVTIVQVDDPKQKGKKRKDKKTGKEYPYQIPEVSSFHGMEDVKASSKKAAGKAAPAAKDKAGKSAKAVEEDVSETATAALMRYLGAAEGNTLAVSKVRLKVLSDAKFKGQPAEAREAVATWLSDVENLEGIEGVSFDAKKKTLTLDE